MFIRCSIIKILYIYKSIPYNIILISITIIGYGIDKVSDKLFYQLLSYITELVLPSKVIVPYEIPLVSFPMITHPIPLDINPYSNFDILFTGYMLIHNMPWVLNG